jgi:hypothetical protein
MNNARYQPNSSAKKKPAWATLRPQHRAQNEPQNGHAHAQAADDAPASKGHRGIARKQVGSRIAGAAARR